MGMPGKTGDGNGNVWSCLCHSREAGKAGMGRIPDPRAPSPIPGEREQADPCSQSHPREAGLRRVPDPAPGFPQELTTVRVQDPRVQNEGSWNSYVDYKIFLHTNSRAFTAKTSCVRRRYREFVWLRRQLQRNAGLVPVPELPGKSAFFVGSTDEFIERRRQGLQHFLERASCPCPPSRPACRAGAPTRSPRPSCTTPWPGPPGDSAGTAAARGWAWPGEGRDRAAVPAWAAPGAAWRASPTGVTWAWTRRGRRAPSVRPDTQ
ncbi:sorting nexin-11 isoform X5 [Ammospiza nelsoni]|uniref:sorting nexin-11 isoform X5 n=1 Tax=Ammospiza nelsoni TaxID=2857394 RepID=UPI00286B0696|nr:sorting nexin-11 isoform X5 [Ammospiza nelsoni]